MQQWTWAQACWTNVEKYPVPVPWQFWQSGPDRTVRDIIQYGGDEVGPAEITRQYVSIPYTIPLEDLTWGYVGSLPWQPVPGDPIVMSPGQIAQIDVPVQVTDRAALVRYEVRTVGTIEPRARVINEALIDAAAAVQDGQERGSLFLAPPRPNPSTGSVEISFRLPEAGPVCLIVADVAGRQVAVLHDGLMEAGSHTLRWDGRTGGGEQALSGVYFYSLTAGSRTLTQRVVLER
jgi:hypothetical protein